MFWEGTLSFFAVITWSSDIGWGCLKLVPEKSHSELSKKKPSETVLDHVKD